LKAGQRKRRSLIVREEQKLAGRGHAKIGRWFETGLEERGTER